MPKTRWAGRRGRGSGHGASQEGAGPTSPSPGCRRPRRGVPLTRADLSPPVSAPVVHEPGPSLSALSEFLALIRQEVRQQLAAAAPAGIQDQSGAPLVPADPVPSHLADPSSGSPAGVVGKLVAVVCIAWGIGFCYLWVVLFVCMGHGWCYLFLGLSWRFGLVAEFIAALSFSLPNFCFYLVASYLTTVCGCLNFILFCQFSLFWEGVAIGEGWGGCFCDVAGRCCMLAGWYVSFVYGMHCCLDFSFLLVLVCQRVHSSLFPCRTPHSFEFRGFRGSSTSSFGISAAANNNTSSSVDGSCSSMGDAPII